MTQKERIVGFFSRRLSATEQRYSTFDRECLGIVAALKHYNYLFARSKVHILTDHKPLVYWNLKPPVSDRHSKWIVAVQGLNIDIAYIPGEQNVLADFLSRPEKVLAPKTRFIDSSCQAVCGVELCNLNADIALFQDASLISQCNKAKLTVEKIGNLHVETSTGRPRIILPEQFRIPVLSAIHHVGHPGEKRTLRLVAQDYYLPGMAGQVVSFVKACTNCRSAKPFTPHKREHVSFPSTRRFQVVHLDLVGPLPLTSRGHTWMLTMMDRFTGWVEAVPLRVCAARDVAEAFFDQ